MIGLFSKQAPRTLTLIAVLAAALIWKGLLAMADAEHITTSQIEALLNEQDVRGYFHFDHPAKRGVLGVAYAEGVTGDTGFQFFVDGGRVVHSDHLPRSDDDNIFIIQSVGKSEDGHLLVAFSYPIEGVAGTASIEPMQVIKVLDIWEQ